MVDTLAYIQAYSFTQTYTHCQAHLTRNTHDLVEMVIFQLVMGHLGAECLFLSYNWRSAPKQQCRAKTTLPLIFVSICGYFSACDVRILILLIILQRLK